MVGVKGYTRKFVTGNDSINGVAPVRVLDFVNQHYYDGVLGKSFSGLNTFTRTGVTWAWQLVSGVLELVEIADGVAPFSVDPVTGELIGIDIMPAITRYNPRYMPAASDMTTSGATVADLTLNALGHFASLKIESTGSTADEARTAVADDTALTAAVNYSFDCYIQDDGESTTVRFGPRGAGTGNSSLIEYTFSTNAITNPVTAGGTFSDLKAVELADGTHRITGLFLPTVTESYGLSLLPNTVTSGDGFTLSAWFMNYWTTQLRGYSPPILGAQGAAYITNRASLTGLLAATGDRTVVMFRERSIKNSNWDYDFSWVGVTGRMGIGNRQDFKNYPHVNDGTNPAQFSINPIQWGERTGIAISYTNGTARFATNDAAQGLSYFERIAALALPDSVNYGVGCDAAANVTIGGTYAKVMFYDELFTENELSEIVQRGM